MRGLCQRLALYLSLCLSLLLYVSPASAASVLAIDYGADYIKASLMKPGLPFDVLLNKDSKRKIHSSVAWKNGERLFGQDAYNLAARKPQDTYNHMKYLLGAPANADIVTYYNQISTSTLVASSRFTVAVPQPGGRTWDIEELVAAQLAYIRQLASDAAGEPVRDAVVTVPPFFSQFERDALADAAELAGLKLITLVSDSAGVAINFAITRQFTSTPEYHVIFDAGGSSTRASVVGFSQDAKGKSLQVALKGVGWDRSVSGTEFTRRLRDMLVAEFKKKHPSVDILADKRAMARIWKEADRVKGILSANNDAVSHVESLIDEIDFRTKISRADFEAKCKDLAPSFAKPLSDALANANLTMNDIKSVILFGGNTRVPMMRRALDAAAGADKIAVNVNADEAAVLGAALHGASLSHSFRTKDIKLSDVLPYDVQVAYAAEAKDGSASGRTIHSTAFAAGSKTGTRKTMSFKRHDDFNLAFQYKQPISAGYPTEFLETRVGGVKEALANITAEGGSEPVIKATLALSESGFISVPEAVAVADAKDDSIAGKLKGLFGDKGSSSAESVNETPTASETAVKSTKTLSIPLTVSVKYPTVAPMSLEQKREARTRLQEQEAKEAAIAMREEQRNGLESYLYRMRDLVNADEQTPFVKCSKPSERSAISKTLEEVQEWFHEHQDTADTKTLLEKRGLLQVLENPIQHRYKEIEEFPSALNESQKWNFHTRMFLKEAMANLTKEEEEGVEGKFNREELEGIMKTLEEHETWLAEKIEAQRKVKMDEDPAVETKEMRERAKVLELHLQRLIGKKPPRRKIPSTSASASFTSTTPTASSTTRAGGHEEL